MVWGCKFYRLFSNIIGGPSLTPCFSWVFGGNSHFGRYGVPPSGGGASNNPPRADLPTPDRLKPGLHTYRELTSGAKMRIAGFLETAKIKTVSTVSSTLLKPFETVRAITRSPITQLKQGVKASYRAFARRLSRKYSTTAGRIEIKTIARITRVKFFRTISMFPKK